MKEASCILDIVSGSETDRSSGDALHDEKLLTESTSLHSSGASAEIHSSFSEEVKTHEVLPPFQPTYDDSSILKNIHVAPDLSETAEVVGFTLVDTPSASLNDKGDQDATSNHTGQPISFETTDEELYIVHAEPKSQVQEKADENVIEREVNESQPVSKSSHEEPIKTVPQHEDIPSFREWTQKQLAEAEKKKGDQNATVEKASKSSGKFRNKNYASPDCGAKIVAANPESVSSSAVLSSSKDEYMLNYCTNRIWFIVELCEAIQAKQLDLANFELFSSSPKHFTVSISNRFPSRDWSSVGKFTAKDSRDVQTFDLNPHLFGKYIKVELRSHYGKEQFCPVSWVGVYGTSEYEVLAKADDHQDAQPDDDDDDDDVDEVVGQGQGDDDHLFVGPRGDSPKNLFSSATDAVLSIVKKATAPFMKHDRNETQTQDIEGRSDTSHISLCLTPRYITVCDNCSQHFYDDIYFLLSCRQTALSRLILSPVVKRTLIEYECCSKYGLDFNTLRPGAPFPKTFKDPCDDLNYVTAMLKDSYVAALCNILAVSENKVVVNASIDASQTLKNLTDKKESCEMTRSSIILPSSTCTIDCIQSHSSSLSKYDFSTSSHLMDVFKPSERFNEKIKPTKTLTEDEIKDLPPSVLLVENTKDRPEAHPTSTPSVGSVIPTATVTVNTEGMEEEKSDVPVPKEEPKVTFVDKNLAEVSEGHVDEEERILASQDLTLDSILSDINELEKAVKSNPASSTMPPPTNLPTESIFLRLVNRIKNLEINMSISSSYLEEMSRRYRSQLEALSKTVNLTAQRMEEQYRVEEERERRREKEMSALRSQLANLTRDLGTLLREKNSWRPRASSISQHIFFVSIEFLVVWIIFSFWKKPGDEKTENKKLLPLKKINKKIRRRNSLEGAAVLESQPRRKERRPSDEALEIALAGNYLKVEKKRKRKKKDSRSSVNVIHVKRKKSENSNTSSDDPLALKASSETVPEEIERIEVIRTNFVEVGELEMRNRFAPISSPFTKNSEGHLNAEPVRRFSSPLFMKTALSSRNSRLRATQSERESSQESTVSNLFDQESTHSEQQPVKQKKGSGSLKKYMRKFF